MPLTHRLRLHVAAALAVGVLALGPLHAQQPSANSVAAARELLAVKGASSVFDPIVIGVIESVKNSFVPTNPGLSKDLNEVALKLRKDYDARRGDLMNEVAKVYAHHFTEAELRDLVAFYRSPLGKKMATQEPLAIDESMKQAQVWADGFSSEMMDKFRDEMKKRGHSL